MRIRLALTLLIAIGLSGASGAAVANKPAQPSKTNVKTTPSSKSYFRAGFDALQKRQNRSAMDYFIAGLSKSPDDSLGWAYLAAASARHGDAVTARAALARAKRGLPDPRVAAVLNSFARSKIPRQLLDAKLISSDFARDIEQGAIPLSGLAPLSFTVSTRSQSVFYVPGKRPGTCQIQGAEEVPGWHAALVRDSQYEGDADGDFAYLKGREKELSCNSRTEQSSEQALVGMHRGFVRSPKNDCRGSGCDPSIDQITRVRTFQSDPRSVLRQHSESMTSFGDIRTNSVETRCRLGAPMTYLTTTVTGRAAECVTRLIKGDRTYYSVSNPAVFVELGSAASQLLGLPSRKEAGWTRRVKVSGQPFRVPGDELVVEVLETSDPAQSIVKTRRVTKLRIK